MRPHHLAALFLLGLSATGQAAPPATTTAAPPQDRPDLAWYREPGLGRNGRGCQVSEAWLIRAP